MRIDSKAGKDLRRYDIYLGDVNVTGIVVEADDVEHRVVLAPRDHDRKVYRHQDGTQLEVTVFGPVTIVERKSAPMLVHG